MANWQNGMLTKHQVGKKGKLTKWYVDKTSNS